MSLVVDVSPNCDCHAENDVPIVPDVGMFASFDPVALDQACADAVLAQTPAPNSALFDEGCDCSSGDYFHAAHPDRIGVQDLSGPCGEDRHRHPGIRAHQNLI